MVLKKAEEKHTKNSCSKCQRVPKVGDDLYITKVNDQWVSCINKECFLSQGAKEEDCNRAGEGSSDGKGKFFAKGGTNYKKPEDCHARLQAFHEFIIINASQDEVINKLVQNDIFPTKKEAFLFIMDYGLKAFLGDLDGTKQK